MESGEWRVSILVGGEVRVREVKVARYVDTVGLPVLPDLDWLQQLVLVVASHDVTSDPSDYYNLTALTTVKTIVSVDIRLHQ